MEHNNLLHLRRWASVHLKGEKSSVVRNKGMFRFGQDPLGFSADSTPVVAAPVVAAPALPAPALPAPVVAAPAPVVAKLVEGLNLIRSVMADPALPAPVVAAPALPAPVVATMSTSETQEQIAARIKREDEYLKKIGIVPTKPLYALGTPVNSWGVANREEKRAEFEALPNAEDALRATAAHIEAEKRSDILVDAKSIRMKNDGSIILNGIDYPVEELAFTKLLARLKTFPSMSRGLLLAPPTTRATFFNDMMGHFWKADEKDATVLRLGTRSNHETGERSIYRAVSSTYHSDTPATVWLRTIAKMVEGKGAKADIAYNPNSTMVRSDVIWNENHKGNLGAGSVFRAGFRARTGDNGGCGFHLDAIAWRNLCLNLLIIATETSSLYNARHSGKDKDIVGGLKAGMAAGMEAFDGLIKGWGYLESTHISQVKIWGKKFATVQAALEYGVEKKKLTESMKSKVALEMMLSGHSYEGGNMLASLINAVTRAAHTTSFLSELQKDAMERKAGQLVKVLLPNQQLSL